MEILVQVENQQQYVTHTFETALWKSGKGSMGAIVVLHDAKFWSLNAILKHVCCFA